MLFILLAGSFKLSTSSRRVVIDKLRICLLTTQDLDAEPFPNDDWPCDPRPFMPEAEWTAVELQKQGAVKKVRELASEGFDVFFNLCDGSVDQDVPGIEVVQTLEKLRVPFTGATSEFFEPPREQMKEVCRQRGIKSPSYVFVERVKGLEKAVERLKFPLFVKHYSSYASIDISRASKVVTMAGLKRQVQKIVSRHGRALIEEFIEGTECTVLVAENPDHRCRPITYKPIQYRFPPGESFKHSDLKWVTFEQIDAFPVTDHELESKLREQSAQAFEGLNGASFGRCDFRVDTSGTPFFLEINSNCGIYYPLSAAGSADLCLAEEKEGHFHFTRQLVEAALRRNAREKKKRRSA